MEKVELKEVVRCPKGDCGYQAEWHGNITQKCCICKTEFEIQKPSEWFKLSEKVPSLEEVEIKYPCELGQTVVMEIDMSYEETINANYFRRQGARWIIDLLKKIDFPTSGKREEG